ncbi:MBL fold metallo-hydrolase [Asanoa ishikariensis]|uniref:L-ascorbate metabolism protein UlaG, beta-lactamase superfamily n=1 Tax=Asanoa ishikariensis TaxID=137265 RepID=A0A1H3UFZ6_9ACTN|nr:MBL fold metallo-hydrolase [Asanoa ishikariensis]GIF63688.1 MBL fold metallo-hydrolase [Asanoa ishikariensis]SDZ60981.1 L-ascorbate metabolism protein UlaG, beta-lactamase superfamily [Asanoa ishikariensis]
MSDVRLTHVGGPTTLVEVAGWRLLTDPTFDPPGRRYGFGLGTSSRKLTGPAVEVDALGPIDAVLLTHDHHADNLDDAGRSLLSLVDDIVTTESGARRLGGRAQGLRPWQSLTLSRPGRPSIEVTATPCRHGPPLSGPLVGDVIGFALAWEGQRHGALWFTGDTVLYGGVREVAGRVPVGTAVLHLGGVRFPITGPLRYSLTARRAVKLCELVRPHTTIPVHYEGWSHFQEPRPAIERAFSSAPAEVRDSVRWLPIGAPTDIDV